MAIGPAWIRALCNTGWQSPGQRQGRKGVKKRGQSQSPHGLCPKGCLQVFYNLAPLVCLLIFSFIQVLHLRPTGKGDRSHTACLPGFWKLLDHRVAVTGEGTFPLGSGGRLRECSTMIGSGRTQVLVCDLTFCM